MTVKILTVVTVMTTGHMEVPRPPPPPLPTLTVLASCCQCYVLLGLERLKLALLYNVVCTVVCSQLQLR